LITENVISRIRPGFGLPPKYFNELIGRKVVRDVERGDPVSWEDIEKGKFNY
jgi:sialic acid synthase SpsE